uniref:hypothetical protein n=1 Tax=Chroodactylon ornatum TaxID=139907 RepID=UPI001FCD576D|nr:hypothetical protein MW609_pgp153 [Chroodactylon ornatum]UNJ14546.1 hypothetical protein [Chroodactylon ornatum]
MQTQSSLTTYWPTVPGRNLNRKVAKTLATLRIKISQNLANQSLPYLPINILSPLGRYSLTSLILHEVEQFILENIGSNLNATQIRQKRHRNVSQLIYKSTRKFFYASNISSSFNYKEIFNYDSRSMLELENDFELLLGFSILGLSDKTKVVFNPIFGSQVPDTQIELLFENFIIQVANFLVDALLRTSEGVTFGFQNQIFDNQYSSIRTVEQFKNNLMWYKFVKYYITIPKNIYENTYSIWVISPKGIICRNISAHRLYDLSELSTTQLTVTFIIEIQDFIIPKISNLIQFCTKALFYLLYEPIHMRLRLLWHNWTKYFS